MRFLVFTAVLIIVFVGLLNAHPLKMAYTAVKYNPDKKVFEISHRVFQDDFENTLKAGYNYNQDVFSIKKLRRHKKQ